MKTVSGADLKRLILIIKSISFQVYWFTCCLAPFDSLLKRKTDLKFREYSNVKVFMFIIQFTSGCNLLTLVVRNPSVHVACRHKIGVARDP